MPSASRTREPEPISTPALGALGEADGDADGDTDGVAAGLADGEEDAEGEEGDAGEEGEEGGDAEPDAPNGDLTRTTPAAASVVTETSRSLTPSSAEMARYSGARSPGLYETLGGVAIRTPRTAMPPRCAFAPS